MNYIIYKATSPSGRIYIGVTNNFKRRMKEHNSSPYPFGHAVRKYGKENFHYEFEEFETLEDALNREAELVTINEVNSRKYYNTSLGGKLTNTLSNNNPMHNSEILKNHPNLWTTENNPMNDPVTKQKMVESQNRKKVSIDGVIYNGVREAARQLDSYRQFIIHRLKSNNFPSWYYL